MVRGEWCGECYAGRRGRSTTRGHYGYRPEIIVRGMSMAEFLKRHCPQSNAAASVGPTERCRWLQDHPALCEFLSLSFWEDGESRIPGTLLLCFGEGRWKCWINDRDSGRTAWLSGGTMTDLLDGLEARLQADNLDWRVAPGSNGKKKLK